MPKTIVVQPGDCLINVSQQEGFFWETVWNHPQNSQLRDSRKHLNIVKPGDKIFIPDRTIQVLPRPTDQLHRFVKKGAAKFTLTLLDLGVPRANQPYALMVNGKWKKGQTDGNGTLSESIPPGAREGLLLVGEKQEEITVDFGYIDPIEEISGVKSRLKNLGFYEGQIDDEMTPETSAAIAEFQRMVELPGEGKLDDPTRAALVDAHES
jgi:hypothetical protein